MTSRSAGGETNISALHQRARSLKGLVSFASFTRIEPAFVDTTGLRIATRALSDALQEHWEEGEASRANEFIREQFQRIAGPRDKASGKLMGPMLYGFQIEPCKIFEFHLSMPPSFPLWL